MIQINRTALVNHSAEQMYDLVNDIESYPKFMHGCLDARVIRRSEHEMVGELTLGKAGIRHSFTTVNGLKPHEEITMELVEGPFRHFSACWRFAELKEGACKVSLEMDFEFAGGLFGFALEKIFNHSANSLVDAVVDRAGQIYG